MKEIWKPVKNHELLYEVSNLGRIKFLPRVVRVKDGFYLRKERVIKNSKTRTGYLSVTFNEPEGSSYGSVHRLVATAFIPNLENKPCVNHKDFNTQNNCVDNLEWVTDKENTFHSIDRLFFNKGMKGEIHPRSLFTNIQVSEIKRMRIEGMKYKDIAKVFNASENTLLAIVNRDYYSRI